MKRVRLKIKNKSSRKCNCIVNKQSSFLLQFSFASSSSAIPLNVLRSVLGSMLDTIDGQVRFLVVQKVHTDRTVLAVRTDQILQTVHGVAHADVLERVDVVDAPAVLQFFHLDLVALALAIGDLLL